MNTHKFTELEKLIGNTPMVTIDYRYQGQTRTASFKCEWYNMTGSIKDRVAFGVLKAAYEKGALKPGQVIAETTSGNMGISFSAIGTYLGHKVVIFMPHFMSEERKQLMRLYGADLRIVQSFQEGFDTAKILKEKEGAFLPLQFENETNPLTHYGTTGKEVLRQTGGDVQAFVAGVGTGGTLMGVGRLLKESVKAKVITVEPNGSKQFSLGYSIGCHKLQGLSDGLVPAIYKSELVDGIIGVDDDDAIAMAQKLSKQFGISVGISSGANFIGCVLSGYNKTASVFSDDGKKYLSSTLVDQNIKSPLADSIELIGYRVTR